jgi:hypothetical protein
MRSVASFLKKGSKGNRNIPKRNVLGIVQKGKQTMEIIFLLIMICIAALIIVISVKDSCITDGFKGNEVVAVAETPEQLYAKCCDCPDFVTCTKGTKKEVRECKRKWKNGT